MEILDLKIETRLTLIARDLVNKFSKSASSAFHEVCTFVLLHINYQVVKTLMYVRWGSAPYCILYVMKH